MGSKPRSPSRAAVSWAMPARSGFRLLYPIAGQFEQVGILPAKDGLVAVLEQPAMAAMQPVKSPGITGVGFTQLEFGAFRFCRRNRTF